MSHIDTLEQWAAEERSIRSRLRTDSLPNSQLRTSELSGMEIFDAIFAGQLATPPMGETLDFVPIQVSPGLAVFQGRPQRRHYNPHGTVHGGWFVALLDSAVACAIHSTLPAGRGYTTLELKVNLVRALTDAVLLVRAEGRVLHVGRQVGTAEGRIVGPDGKLYAHATTTCLIFDHPQPRPTEAARAA